MATVDSRSRRRRRADYDYDDEPRSRRRRKSHAFRNGSIVMLLGGLALLYFAPAIIAHTPLRNTLVQRALKLDGTVTVGSASLGWFFAIEADDIEIRDAAGDSVVEIGRIRTDKQLVGMLLDFGNFGRIEIDHLEVNAVCQEKTSNLEQVFAAMLADDSQSQVAAELLITDGTITIEDAVAGRTYRVEQLGVDCKLSDDAEPIILAASGTLVDKRQPGNFKLDLRTKRSADGKNPVASGKLDCTATAIPLELADPLARRVVDEAQCGGQLSTRLSGAWGELAEAGEASVRGETLVTNLTFAARSLGHDQIKLARVEMPCHLVQNGDTLEVEKLAVNCELGHVTLTGTAKMSDFSAADKLAALVRENYQLTGEIDLVQVARVLPETLRIRAGTEITSGNISLAVTSRHEKDDMTWTGKIDAKRLGAKAEGKSLVWENPLAVDFAARQTAGGIVLDKAECTSSFLHASASGSLDDLNANATFDLARLLAELKQFADFSQLQLAGQGEAKLALKRGEGNKFTAEGEFRTTGFQFVPVAGGQPWKEELVVARFDLGGQLEQQQLKRVDRASLNIEAGSERLAAQLREPVVDPAAAVWPIQCSWSGNLAQWSPRLAAVLDLSGWDLRGTGEAQATLACSRQAIVVESGKCDIMQLQVWGHEWFINEPAASLAFDGRYDLEKSRAELGEARFTAGTTAAVVRKAIVQAIEDGWKLDGGTAEIGADLVTFYRWRHDPRLPAQWRVYGRLAAEADVKHDAGVTTARLDGTIDQLKLIDLTQGATQPAWQEPRITLAAIGIYRQDNQQLKLDGVQLASAALRVDGSGVVPMSGEGGDVDVKGTLQYDWQQLAPLWRPLLGDGVQIAGRQTRSFAVRGRLTGSPALADSWRQVTGEASVGWSGMNLYGFAVGPGTIEARLADGQARTTQPIDFAVSEGRFTLSPVARFSPAPAELYIPRGPLLTNIHLSPEMCKRGLKFVAPIVAETTVAEGRFSVNMDGGRIPLADPKGGDLGGHMAIRAQVKPGPVAEEFLVLVNELLTVVRRGSFQPLNEQTGSLMSIDTADVEFRMVGRRVYHRNLKFVVGTLPITTHGSVGLDDESLSMVAEVPIRANLLGRDLSVGTLEGQTIQIPIGGTLSKPKLDKGVLSRFTGQLIQNMTRGALFNEVNRQLDRFLPVQPQR